MDKLHATLMVFEYQLTVSVLHEQSKPDSDEQFTEISSRSIGRFLAEDRKRATAFTHLLARDFRGVFLIRDGIWVAYGWFSVPGHPGPAHLPQWVKRFDAYWIFGCRTKEEFRGRGYFQKVLHRIVEDAKDGARIYADTRINNIASRRGMLTAGFRPRGVINTYRVWIPRWGSPLRWGSWDYYQRHPDLPSSQQRFQNPVSNSADGRPLQISL